MPMSPKQIVKFIESNGFKVERQNGSHKFFRNEKTGKTTTVPMHVKD